MMMMMRMMRMAMMKEARMTSVVFFADPVA